MSNKLFTHVPVPKFPSSTFSLSRPVMGTPRMKKVYPGNIVEIVPGDGIRAGAEVFARAQPMIAPVFSKMRIRQESWFVPFWQIHEKFDDFITGGERADFTAHMPWIPVSRIYRFLERSLYVAYLTPAGAGGSWFNQAGSDFEKNKAGYTDWLARIIDMIDMFDYTRSVPLKMPDFLDPSGASTQEQLNTIMESNYTAFITLNSQLNGSSLRINLAPFIAYQKVWCEFYRDENLFPNYYETVICDTYSLNTVLDSQDSLFLSIAQRLYGSSSLIALGALRNLWYIFGIKDRAWSKDLFTSALPWVQKGPDVLLPLSGEFPVDVYGGFPPTQGSDPVNVTMDQIPTDGRFKAGYTAVVGGSLQRKYLEGSLTLDESGLATTITDFRRALKLEEFYEADGRGGNRYPENTLMQFGVRTPDSRLPRAQFLGSNSQPIAISEVVQTSSTDAVTPQGNLAGKGTSYGRGSLCRKYFTMHGFWLCFFTIDYGAIYEQGIHPMFSRFDRTEYAWPRFAHLGEQPIYTKQLFVDSTVTENETFGYGPRYVDYKSDQGSIHGLLKSSLNFWTMARRFSNKPVLNEEFIYSKPRQDSFAVSNPFSPPFILEIDYRVRANRKLPFFGVPML